MGTVIRDGGIHVGGIVRTGHDKRDMDRAMWYHSRGHWFCSYNLETVETIQTPAGRSTRVRHRRQVTKGDKVAIATTGGKLYFTVNGERRGDPVTLPYNTDVAMAVSVYNAKVRLS